MAEGIADLSYRHYSGKLGKPKDAWRVIAGVGIRAAFKNRAFWIYTALSGWYYMILVSFLYIMEQSLQAFSAGGSGGGQGNVDFAQQVFQRLIWGDQLLLGFSSAQLLIVVVTMIIGAGSIAADNRSNALLIYLSRPCTKWSYIFGKWMGVFIPLLVVVGLPSLIFYAYGALNYRERGFLSDDPWAIVKLLGLIPVCAAFYSSLIVGISSLFRQPRMASAVFFGLYILSFFFSILMRGLVSAPRTAAMPEGLKRLAEEASYFSVSGLMQGISKIIFNSNGSQAFAGARGNNIIPKPDLWLSIPPVTLVILLGLLLAWNRVRAVEVVK